MRLSVFQEELASLYLRLNGYLVSGFIIHGTPNGKATDRGEIDVIGVRFPNNVQKEREIEPSPFLQVSNTSIDIIVCEVKGREAQLQFNDSLRSNQENIKRVLRWIGAFEEEPNADLVERVCKMFVSEQVQSSDDFPYVASPPCPQGIQIRAILFAPDRPAPRPNQPRFVCGNELIEFIWNCLRPEKVRSECADRYNFGLWGQFEDLVRHFKESAVKPTMECLYRRFVNG